jgi:hypothetical protein
VCNRVGKSASRRLGLTGASRIRPRIRRRGCPVTGNCRKRNALPAVSRKGRRGSHPGPTAPLPNHAAPTYSLEHDVRRGASSLRDHLAAVFGPLGSKQVALECGFQSGGVAPSRTPAPSRRAGLRMRGLSCGDARCPARNGGSRDGSRLARDVGAPVLAPPPPANGQCCRPSAEPPPGSARQFPWHGQGELEPSDPTRYRTSTPLPLPSWGRAPSGPPHCVRSGTDAGATRRGVPPTRRPPIGGHRCLRRGIRSATPC